MKLSPHVNGVAHVWYYSCFGNPRYLQVTLNCTGEDPESLQKRVQIIRNCSCSTCDAGDDVGAMSPLSASGDGEVGTDHKASLPDVGDLIDFMLKTQNKGPAAGPTGESIVIVQRDGNVVTWSNYVLNIKIASGHPKVLDTFRVLCHYKRFVKEFSTVGTLFTFLYSFVCIETKYTRSQISV